MSELIKGENGKLIKGIQVT